LFGINIIIYKYSDDKNNLNYLNSYIYEEENKKNTPSMILVYENLKHYNLIYTKIEIIENTNIKKVKDLESINDEESKIINEGTFLKSDEIIEDKNNITDVETLLKNGNSMFPKNTLDKDERLYLHIFKFLRNGIQNGKRTWPDYIEMIGDKKIRDNKKTEFYRKMGLIKVTKARLAWLAKNREKFGTNNKDKKFDESEISENQDRYSVENDRLYIYRYEKDKNSENPENNEICIRYMIPFTKDINAIMNECHDKINHQGVLETVNSIKSKYYYWVSIYDDVTEYINNCNICKNNSNNSKVLNK